MLLAAVDRDPHDVASRYYLGVEYGGAGMHAAAAALFERWLEPIEQVIPRQGALRARQQYATALHALGRTGLAARVAAEGARRYDSAVLSALAAGYTSASDPAAARRLAESALHLAERSSGEPWPRHTVRAAALTVLGDLSRPDDVAEARRRYLAAAAADPSATQPHHRLSDLAADAGDLPAARSALLDALAVAPADVATHLALALLERRMGLLQEPFDRLTAQVAATPRNLDLRLGLAAVLYDAGEYSLGVDVLSAAEELPELDGAPPAFRAHYFARLAHGCVEAKRFDDAMRAYRSAFQADPGRAGPRPVAPGSLVQIVPGAAVVDPVAPVGRA
jgi:tetratricopeptide (TPR) repeat protein